jgi:hypothetical protein
MVSREIHMLTREYPENLSWAVPITPHTGTDYRLDINVFRGFDSKDAAK